MPKTPRTHFRTHVGIPGGKQEPGETSRQALVRELREELAIEAIIGEEVHRTIHYYDELRQPLELIFFAAAADLSTMQNLVFEQIQWREPQSLPELDFLPADRELVERLAKGTLHLPAVQENHKNKST